MRAAVTAACERGLARFLTAAAAAALGAAALLAAASPVAARAEVLQAPGEAAWPHTKRERFDWLGSDYDGVIARLDLAAPAPAVIAAAQAGNPGAGRIQVGVPIAASAAGEVRTAALDWRVAGNWITARFETFAPGARALRVAVDLPALPPGTPIQIRARGDTDPVGVVGSGHAPIEAQRGALGFFWTPLTEGQRQLVEIAVPVGVVVPAGALRADILGASYLFTSFSDRVAAAKASAPCQVDVACLASVSPAVAEAERAVARLSFVQDGKSYFCTGTLLNDTDGSSQIPYLLTGNHCIASAAVAATLVTRWGYQKAECTSPAEQVSTQLSGGAALLATSSGLDLTLLRLNDPAPAGSRFAGWDASGPPALDSGISVIHHPQGDLKKVSIGKVTGFINTPGGGRDPGIILVGYTLAATEGGSSGAALLTSRLGDLQVRGTLISGASSCASVNDFSPGSPNVDLYSRFDLFFPAIRAFLQPTPPGKVVEYYLSARDQYFYTADPGEQGFVDGGGAGPWQRTGRQFNVGGPTPVCRFYGNTNVNPGTGAIFGPASHFYTADAGECDFLRSLYNPAQPSWRFESLDFVTTRPAQGACPAGTAPVYRAYNNGFTRGRDSNHRLSTAQSDIADVVARGWSSEGVVMCAPL